MAVNKVGIAAIIILAVILAAVYSPSFPPIPPPDGNGLGETIRIAMFGCLHVGETTQSELDDAGRAIRALNPDYVLSVGDWLQQDQLGANNDAYQNSYINWLHTLNVPMNHIFHCIDEGHDGWGHRTGFYYDGYFRLLGETSTHWVRKIGNLAIISMGGIRGSDLLHTSLSQLEWFEDTVRELASQDYNILVLKHIPLYHTVAYTSEAEPWVGECTEGTIWFSNYVTNVANQFSKNVVMLIHAHIHIDATDIDPEGRGAFLNWTEVQGNSKYLQVKAYVVNVAGISTTMHGNQYKSYQNLWYMDLTEGASHFTLKALNIDAEPDREVLTYSIPLSIPFSGLTQPILYEHMWGPCKFPNNLAGNPLYVNDKTSRYLIYFKASTTSWFESKFRFNTEVQPIDILIDYEGTASSIKREIAYSSDGFSYSAFTEGVPSRHAKYWKVKITITAVTQVDIYNLQLLT